MKQECVSGMMREDLATLEVDRDVRIDHEYLRKPSPDISRAGHSTPPLGFLVSSGIRGKETVRTYAYTKSGLRGRVGLRPPSSWWRLALSCIR